MIKHYDVFMYVLVELQRRSGPVALVRGALGCSAWWLGPSRRIVVILPIPSGRCLEEVSLATHRGATSSACLSSLILREKVSAFEEATSSTSRDLSACLLLQVYETSALAPSRSIMVSILAGSLVLLMVSVAAATGHSDAISAYDKTLHLSAFAQGMSRGASNEVVKFVECGALGPKGPTDGESAAYPVDNTHMLACGFQFGGKCKYQYSSVELPDGGYCKFTYGNSPKKDAICTISLLTSSDGEKRVVFETVSGYQQNPVVGFSCVCMADDTAEEDAPCSSQIP